MPRVKKEPSDSFGAENHGKRKIKSEDSTGLSALDGMTADERSEFMRAVASGAKLLKEAKKKHQYKRSSKRDYSSSDYTSSDSETSSESTSEYSTSSDSDSGRKLCVDKRDLEWALGVKIRKHKNICKHNSSSSSTESNDSDESTDSSESTDSTTSEESPKYCKPKKMNKHKHSKCKNK